MNGTFVQKIEYAFFWFWATLLYPLPFSWLEGAARFLADFLSLFIPKRKKTALRNLDLAFGDSLSLAEKKRIARISFQNSFVTVMELITVERILKNLSSHVEMTGAEYFHQAHKDQKGTLLIFAHLGCWEYNCMAPHLTQIPTIVIVKSVRNPYLNQRLKMLRKKMSVNAVYKDEPGALRKSLESLKRHEIVAVPIDQWAGPEGVWVDFFKKPTSTTSLPAKLGKKIESRFIFVYVIRKSSGHYHVHAEPLEGLNFEDPDYEEQVTLRLNQKLEELIRKYPEHWNWVHRRWKPKPHNL